MIDGRNVFDQPIKSFLKTYDNIRKITIGQEDDYRTNCLLAYISFKQNSNHWMLILQQYNTTN